MSDQRRLSQKTRLYYNDPISELWVRVAHVSTITGPGAPSPEVEITTLESDAIERIPGLQDNGSLDFDVILDLQDETQQFLIDARASREVVDWKIEYPYDPVVEVTFQGSVGDFSKNASQGEALTASVNIIIRGDLTYDFGDSA